MQIRSAQLQILEEELRQCVAKSQTDRIIALLEPSSSCKSSDDGIVPSEQERLWAAVYEERQRTLAESRTRFAIQGCLLSTGEPSGVDSPRCSDSLKCDQKARETLAKIYGAFYLNSAFEQDSLNPLSWTMFKPRFQRALEHYVGGSGQWLEIPTEYRDEVLDASWEIHRDTAWERMVGEPGISGQIALKELLVDPSNPDTSSVKPINLWPKEVMVTLPFENAKPTPKILKFTDESLEYANSTIRSRVTFYCELESPRRYACTNSDWQSWVVDNYDFEWKEVVSDPSGNIAVVDKPGLLDKVITTEELAHLVEVGCAKPYQRTSKSRRMEPEDLAGLAAEVVYFDFTDDEIRRLAKLRFRTNLTNEVKEQTGARYGSLPSPAPAEEMQEN